MAGQDPLMMVRISFNYTEYINMGRRKATEEKKEFAQSESLLSDVKKTAKEREKELAINDMPLNNIGDYKRYNERCREANKKLKVCRYHVKKCPLEMHPTQRIIFGRNDQPANPLPVFLINEMIEFNKKLIPGKTYDLPLMIIDYLAQKGTPIWDWLTHSDGSRETYKKAMNPRFSLRTVYKD